MEHLEDPAVKERADRAEAVFSYFYNFVRDDPAAPVTEILADLRHYCDRHCLDFAELDREAYSHYLKDLEEIRRRS